VPWTERLRDYNWSCETSRHQDDAWVFKCLRYRHSVTTWELSSRNGNCRTHATPAMDEHVTVA